ncbi:MAG: penicillin-binding protein 2 [Burkholderiales bacterium]
MNNYAPNRELRLRLEGWRAHVVMFGLLGLFVVLSGRAVFLQGMKQDFLQQKGEARYSRVMELPANRGMVKDRNGELLAISTPVESIWASPDDVEASPQQTEKLARLMGMTRSDVNKKLNTDDKNFVYLKRQIPKEDAAKIMALQIPGIFQTREYRRYYPLGAETSHLLGFTGADDNGQEGIELAQQKLLSGKSGSRRVIKDRKGQIIEDVETIKAPQPGHDLMLSIDERIQHAAHKELKNAVLRNKAKAGAIVVLDAKTGEVLALANLPDFNPNNREKLTAAQTRNRVMTDTFEPGSTMKPFTAAAALETGKFSPGTFIETGGGTMTIGPATIHDAHKEGRLTVEQVIQKSSNVGAAKMALALPAEYLWNVFNHAGFGTAPKSGFPGEVSGRLRPFKTWRPIEQATMAYGHGVTVSLLQLARAYTVFANDGEILPVTLLKTDTSPKGQHVFSAKTTSAVTKMLEMATQVGGTGIKAQVPGYRVAGKTGTTHKLDDGVYSPDKFVSSFVGFAPASNPRLIIAVMIDEPNSGEHFGGLVAAPVFSAVMSDSLRHMGIPQDAPLPEGPLIPQEHPLIKEEV